ncbi:hypothetical protein [Pseudoroseicyclus sp. CXY001]|uniref:hypothetical protein n=1 Tax=Pseudoroseicyclus sp. CXY001 TaxID=3242492 RepID=UPI003571038D
MGIVRLGAALALCTIAGTAGAECLSAADLGRGVVARFENGDFTVMRRQADGYLTIEENYVDGTPPTRFRAHRGIYFVAEGESDGNGGIVPGTGLEVVFEVDPARLPEPLPGVAWEGPTVNVFDDGSTRNEVMSVHFSAAPPLTLSGCDYEVIRAEIRYDWGPDGGAELTYLYLPEVTTAVILSNQFDGDDLFTTTPVGLERHSK